MTLQRLYDNLEVLENWQERYRFIIEMGMKIPKLDEAEKKEENRVHGCMSTVYMTLKLSADEVPKVQFMAESDTWIVNGLIAILRVIYNGKTLEELAEINISEIFAQMGLEGHLSPNRRNGFFAMVERIKNLNK